MASDSKTRPLSCFPHELYVQTRSEPRRQSINLSAAFYPILPTLALKLHMPVNSTIAPARYTGTILSIASFFCLLTSNHMPVGFSILKQPSSPSSSISPDQYIIHIERCCCVFLVVLPTSTVVRSLLPCKTTREPTVLCVKCR